MTGAWLEFAYSGFQGLPNFPSWILVYGPMVWIPAHFAPANRAARTPAWWCYALAVVLPPFFLPLDLVLAPPSVVSFKYVGICCVKFGQWQRATKACPP